MGFLPAPVERKGAVCRRAERRRVDASGQLAGQITGLQVSLLFQNGPQGVHPLQRGSVFLLPAGLPPPAVEAQAVVGVVDDPAEGVAPAGKRIVHSVHRLGQRGKALGHCFQPGGGGRKPGRFLGRRGGLRHRCQPMFWEKGGGRKAQPGAEEQGQSRAGGGNTEHPQHTPARTGGKGLSPPPGGQQDRGRRAAAEPHRRRGKGRVCCAERGPGEGSKGQRGLFLPTAAEGGIHHGAGRYPKAEGAEAQPAQRRRHGRSGQQGAKTGLFGWEALQRIAEAARQQGICPAEEHQREACPAGPQRKADTSQHQRPAPGQKCRAEPAGPEPSGGHGRPHSAEQAEAVQRKCPEPVEQDAQRSSGCAGGKAVRRQAQCQPQPKGEQGPVENGPAPGKPQRKGPALPQGRAYRRPGGQRGGNRLLRVQFCGFRHEKIPAFRRGSFAMFCFPRPLHIL